MSYLIYKHTNKINGKVYIGQSKYSWENIKDRWQNGRGYGKNTRLGLAIEKYRWDNFEHSLVEDGIETEYEENLREIYWIKFYDSYMYGYNCTIGGKNIPDNFCYKVPVYCIQNKKVYGSIMEASHDLNYSYHSIQRQIVSGRHYRKDKYIIIEDREKDAFVLEYYVANKNYDYLKRSIICVETGEIWDSITECSRELGIKSQNLSQNCCIHHKTAHGLHFSYLDEYNETWEKSPVYDTERRKKCSTRKKCIYCLQTNSFYESAAQASEKLGIPVRLISNCASGHTVQTYGYNFCYKEDWYDGWKPRSRKSTSYKITEETRQRMVKASKRKPVICLETSHIYFSTRDAERKTGVSSTQIQKVCARKLHYNTAGGYHWKYVEEEENE